MPYYKGFTCTNIYYDEDRSEWVMSHDPDNGIMGTAVASILPMGTGALKWSLNKDICNRNSLDAFDALMTVCTVRLFLSLFNLIFNVEQRDQFTCHFDGKCISMEERCDQFPHCSDFSDENECQLVVLPENYVVDYAPFTVNDLGFLEKVPVQIKVCFYLHFLDICQIYTG